MLLILATCSFELTSFISDRKFMISYFTAAHSKFKAYTAKIRGWKPRREKCALRHPADSCGALPRLKGEKSGNNAFKDLAFSLRSSSVPRHFWRIGHLEDWCFHMIYCVVDNCIKANRCLSSSIIKLSHMILSKSSKGFPCSLILNQLKSYTNDLKIKGLLTRSGGTNGLKQRSSFLRGILISIGV